MRSESGAGEVRDSADPNSEQSGLPRPRIGGLGDASAVRLGSTDTVLLLTLSQVGGGSFCVYSQFVL